MTVKQRDGMAWGGRLKGEKRNHGPGLFDTFPGRRFWVDLFDDFSEFLLVDLVGS
jgi:hypothetical protein